MFFELRLLSLIAAIVIAPVLGFSLPPTQPDGLYLASYDASGNEVHTPVNVNITSDEYSPKRDSSRTSRRTLIGVQNNPGCGNYWLGT